MADKKKDELTASIDSGRRGMIKGLALLGASVAGSTMLVVDDAEAGSSKKKSSKKKVSKKKASKKKVSKKKASKKKRSKKK